MFPVNEPKQGFLDTNLGFDTSMTPFSLARFRHLALLGIEESNNGHWGGQKKAKWDNGA